MTKRLMADKNGSQAMGVLAGSERTKCNNHPLGKSEIEKSKMGYCHKGGRKVLDTWHLGALGQKDGRKIIMSME